MSNNDHLILISGKTATGKSLSLRNIPDPKGVMYLNCESNKKLPFKSGFQEHTIVDPLQIFQAFTHAETVPSIHTIVIDSLTYMMDMYVTVHVNSAADTRKAWGDYAAFFRTLMNQYVARSTKNVIFTAHTQDILNESEMVMDTMVKVNGSLMNIGIESFFSTVISTKKVSLKDLEGYENPLLTFTDEEKALGYKYVYQTKLTKKTVNERIRSPIDMWSVNETFINNDAGALLTRLQEYYQ